MFRFVWGVLPASWVCCRCLYFHVWEQLLTSPFSDVDAVRPAAFQNKLCLVFCHRTQVHRLPGSGALRLQHTLTLTSSHLRHTLRLQHTVAIGNAALLLRKMSSSCFIAFVANVRQANVRQGTSGWPLMSWNTSLRVCACVRMCVYVRMCTQGWYVCARVGHGINECIKGEASS